MRGIVKVTVSGVSDLFSLDMDELREVVRNSVANYTKRPIIVSLETDPKSEILLIEVKSLRKSEIKNGMSPWDAGQAVNDTLKTGLSTGRFSKQGRINFETEIGFEG